MDYLFEKDYPEKIQENKNTCKTCEHRITNHYRSGRRDQYCRAIHSNRTHNKFLKIKVNKQACRLYSKRIDL